MRKFIIKFLLIISTVTSISNADESLLKRQQLTDLINNFLNINHQISIINYQTKDKNISNSDLESLQKSKEGILQSIALSIVTYTNSDFIALKNKKIKALKESKNLKNGSKEQSLASLNLLNLQIDEIFYGSIFELSKAFRANIEPTNIANIIQNSIISLQTKGYIEIKNTILKLSPDSQKELETQISNINLSKQSYEEILDYLRSHSELLGHSYLFSSLNLKGVINYINKYNPIDSGKFNLGKFILIIATLAFFISIRGLLSKVLVMSFTNFLSKAKNGVKEQFTSVIKKPISAFLIVYALDFCISVLYYPGPIPLIFANYSIVLYLVIGAWFIIGMLDGYGMIILSKIAQKSGRKEVINLIIKILYFVVVIITILLILSRLGFDISTIIASLGIGGLAVALATKDIIANFFASIMLLFDNAFSQGDWIVCGDIEGTVVEIGLRKTTVRTFDNALVFVPNSTIMSQNVKNWSRRKVGRQIKLIIGVEYGTSTDKLKTCIDEIKKMLLNHPKIAKSAEDNALNSGDLRLHYRQNMVSVDDLAGYKSNLFVVLDTFADSSINILIYCFSKSIVWGEFLAIKQDVMIKIMEILQRLQINFAFPSQSLYIEKLPQFIYNPEFKGDKDA